MGSDCTASALENRFRRIKQDGKRINDAISKGIDPLSLGIGIGEGTINGPNEFFYHKTLHNPISIQLILILLYPLLSGSSLWPICVCIRACAGVDVLPQLSSTC